MQAPVIPNFFLYGEAPRTVDDRFLHLEALEDRSRPSDWTIRAHAHANLNHIFHFTRGGGVVRAEGQSIRLPAPCLLLMPAGVVHGFDFEPETVGSVLTVSDTTLRELLRREPEFRPLFAAPAVIPVVDQGFILASLGRLSRELAWLAPGRAAAVEALLVGILVEVLRLAQAGGGETAAPGPQALLVARFRERIEERYRSHDEVEDYARALAVSPKRLWAACRRVAGAPPARLIQDRLLLEAKRLLLYSNISVADAGYALGFTDPAYFSRLFAKETGLSPRAFRRGGDARPQAAQLQTIVSTTPPSTRSAAPLVAEARGEAT
ncbi:AraC family transcriptional activator of pobA [Inquilinus ginsengisoli]|uniref:AraC family transcriptional activator of pobA n=1 Tax=Inquilinus ginsengisoli TaxID=363840 RepID=A0ABU1JNY8_9PROT|nr:helix-turn-helix domain-containing protein [Inquilinus ginsengisoli]MDR6290338.1 AraC family transcriptional activator of pobA [Inquilinus ginsengisoli]